jgi:D-sedoheptulose 7-phosphate isomerase
MHVDAAGVSACRDASALGDAGEILDIPVLSALSERAERHLRETTAVHDLVARSRVASVVAAAYVIGDAFANGHKLMLCGNGGSAADCQHVAAEFVSRLRADLERPALPALALTTDTSFLTAFANDCGYDGVFARQVQAFGQVGDVLLAISTSGRSANVAKAIESAHAAGVQTIGLFGEGGTLESKVDVAITIPSRDTQVVQECMLSIEHALCELVEESLFGDLRRSTVS